MKKIITVLVVAFSCVLTSCDKLKELGIIDSTKYFIEMKLTYDEWGFEDTFISTYTEYQFNPVRGDTLSGRVYEETPYEDVITTFDLQRENVPIRINDNSTLHVYIGFKLFLQDIPLVEGEKYYFGDVNGIDTSDGVVVPNLYNPMFNSSIAMWGAMDFQMSTFGWIKFTRIDINSTYQFDNAIDLEFEFEVKDPETGEITFKVEDGKIFDNPVKWTIDEI